MKDGPDAGVRHGARAGLMSASSGSRRGAARRAGAARVDRYSTEAAQAPAGGSRARARGFGGFRPAGTGALRDRRLQLSAGADRRRLPALAAGGRRSRPHLPRARCADPLRAAAARALPARAATSPSASTSRATFITSSTSIPTRGPPASSPAASSTASRDAAAASRADVRARSGNARSQHARRNDRQRQLRRAFGEVGPDRSTMSTASMS